MVYAIRAPAVRVEKMRANKRRAVEGATRVWHGPVLHSKTCTSCCEHKTAESFSPRASSPDGKTAHCKKCVAEAVQEYIRKRLDEGRGRPSPDLEKQRGYDRKKRQTPEGKAKNLADAQRYRAAKRELNCGCVSGKMLTTIWNSRNGCCEYCDKPAEHFDHEFPLALRGKHCVSNLRLACAFCNTSKGAKTLSEFLSYRGDAVHSPVAAPMFCVTVHDEGSK